MSFGRWSLPNLTARRGPERDVEEGTIFWIRICDRTRADGEIMMILARRKHFATFYDAQLSPYHGPGEWMNKTMMMMGMGLWYAGSTEHPKSVATSQMQFITVSVWVQARNPYNMSTSIHNLLLGLFGILFHLLLSTHSRPRPTKWHANAKGDAADVTGSHWRSWRTPNGDATEGGKYLKPTRCFSEI